MNFQSLVDVDISSWLSESLLVSAVAVSGVQKEDLSVGGVVS